MEWTFTNESTWCHQMRHVSPKCAPRFSRHPQDIPIKLQFGEFFPNSHKSPQRLGMTPWRRSEPSHEPFVRVFDADFMEAVQRAVVLGPVGSSVSLGNIPLVSHCVFSFFLRCSPQFSTSGASSHFCSPCPLPDYFVCYQNV